MERIGNLEVGERLEMGFDVRGCLIFVRRLILRDRHLGEVPGRGREEGEEVEGEKEMGINNAYTQSKNLEFVDKT